MKPAQKGGPREVALYGLMRSVLTVPLSAGLGPSREAARSIGRVYGRLGMNRKRVDRAVERVAVAVPGVDADAARELVLRSYEHLAMLAVEIGALPRVMERDTWFRHVEVSTMRDAISTVMKKGPIILITGHCGNWEVVGGCMAALGVPMHALYRPLDLKPLDDWVRRTRGRVGIHLVDKFGAMELVPTVLETGGRVGFVADQNAGDRGLFVPFMGRLASTYKSIGIMAQKYRASVIVGAAERLGWDEDGTPASLGRRVGGRGLRYRLRVVDVFGPEDYEAQPDPVFYLTARYRRGIEAAVRALPEQYLWMHRIWKSRPRHERLGKPFPGVLREKLEQLPWMTDAGVEALVDRSDRDAAWLREHDTDRLP